ncbi:MAG: EAL domain-containing protein [Hungatella sp.]|nr:EAL domain-containing protein [Hungatella sp.]
MAEGVETKEQVHMLHELDCDYYQGFYFSRALSCDKFMEYVNQHGISEDKKMESVTAR